MPTQVTFHTELSREAFQVLRDELNTLIGEPFARATSAPREVAAATEIDFGGAARDLYRRLNPKLQGLLRHLMEHYEGERFTWEQVATDMGRDTATVKSWHRSLSKPLNRLAREHLGSPPLLTGSWDGTRNHYTVSPAWRAALTGV